VDDLERPELAARQHRRQPLHRRSHNATILGMDRTIDRDLTTTTTTNLRELPMPNDPLNLLNVRRRAVVPAVDLRERPNSAGLVDLVQRQAANLHLRRARDRCHTPK